MPMMPILPLPKMTEGLDKSDAAIIAACINKRTGKLLAAKPFHPIDFSDLKLPSPLYKATVNYVWRILCFDLCDFRPHDSLPLTADWDVSAWYYRTYGRDYNRAVAQSLTDALEKLVRQVEAKLPPESLRGSLRWGRVFGEIEEAKRKSKAAGVRKPRTP